MAVVAADASLQLVSLSGQFASAAGLSVDGQAVAAGDGDALCRVQCVPVRKNEMHLAGDGDALRDGDVAVYDVPAAARITASPCVTGAVHHRGAVAGLLLAFFIQVFYTGRICQRADPVVGWGLGFRGLGLLHRYDDGGQGNALRQRIALREHSCERVAAGSVRGVLRLRRPGHALDLHEDRFRVLSQLINR